MTTDLTMLRQMNVPPGASDAALDRNRTSLLAVLGSLAAQSGRPSASLRLLFRVAVPADAEATARLHRTHLNHGFLPQLGERFVRAWHRAAFTSPRGISLVAELDGRVVAFLLGSMDQPALTADLVARTRLRLLLAGLLGLVGHPAVAISFLRTRLPAYWRRLTGRRTPSAVEPTTDASQIAVVSALVVDPECQGMGVGAVLLDAFVRAAGAGGATRAELVTLDGPSGAGPFYERQGWWHVDTHPGNAGADVRLYRLAVYRGTSPGRRRAT